MIRKLSLADRLTAAADRALRTLAAKPPPARPAPGAGTPAAELSIPDKRAAAALMRVNHVGEVCAQALYDAQALAATDPQLRALFQASAQEEADHLAWTRSRIEALDGRVSLLNPLWYGGAFGIGLLAARAGDRVSLGFMAETERQVEQHLDSHLERLPPDDSASRVVLEQIKADEVQHAERALGQGGAALPLPARWAMRLAARVMTTTARYI
jgi:ubiquinone biosynthesis monooxygenase Coq7